MSVYLSVVVRLNSTKAVGERVTLVATLPRKALAQQLVLVVFPQLQR
jgi:hypothetical protein